MSNKSFSNKKTLKYGIVENPFSHPRILHDNNTIVLVSINDIDDEIQEYSIDLITPNNDIINIKNEKGYIFNRFVDDRIVGMLISKNGCSRVCIV